MTDRAIAAAYIQNELRNTRPDHYRLREAAHTNLTAARCERIKALVLDMLEELRKPFVDILTTAGVDVT